MRSERMLVEQLEYNLLFRWFVGLGMDGAVWTPTTFTKNRERLLAGDIARQVFTAVLAQARGRRLLSDEHFTVDGTLLEAWAGQKSFTRKDGTSPGLSDDPGNPTVNLHGERRSNETHQSTTDPDSRLVKKTRGSEAKLAYLSEVLMDNRHGLVVDACVVRATGTGECAAAFGLLAALPPGEATVGADKAYDNQPWVTATRQLGVTPHVAQKQRSAVDGRTTRHSGYAGSQRVRKRVEEIFGWIKTVGGLGTLRHRWGDRVEWHFLFGDVVIGLFMRRISAAC